MTRLPGRVAVVTGAAGGLGRALACGLAEAGADVAVCDVDPVGLRETARLVEAKGRRVHTAQVDVSDQAAVAGYAEQVVTHFGRVNVLVNNAGVGLMADFELMTADHFERVMNINFWGVVNLTRAFLPALIDSGEGHVVNISSAAGLMAAAGQTAYCSSKFAVRGFSESLRQEMLINKRPVAVTCVHPGGVKTDIARNAVVVGRDTTDFVERFDKIVARMTADDAAAKILRAVRRNSPRAVVGADAKIADALVRLLGPAYQRLMALLVRTLQPDATDD